MQFIHEAVSQAESMNINVGIYSNEHEWNKTMGNDTSFSDYPLWYAHYNLIPQYDDFVEFGGMKKVILKF